jgi:hypothetical protein
MSTSLPALYQSPAFQAAQSSQYRLALGLAPFGVDYAITNETGEVLLVHRYENERELGLYELLDRVCFEDELLKLRFSTIEIMLYAQRWMLVPNDYFAQGNESKFLETQFDVLYDADHSQRDFLRPLSTNTVYAESRLFGRKCDFYFKTYTYRHAVSPHLLESNRVHKEKGYQYSLQLGIFNRKLLAILMGPKGLHLCNDFPVQTPEDVLYFALSALHTLEIPAAETVVYATGKSNLREQSLPLLQQAFPKFTPSNQLFPEQKAMEAAGIGFDNFPHLFSRISHTS